MPDWFKSLGRKLLATGAAYLEQVKLVDELKKLPPDQARERFMAYVQGLSAGARAGLTLTLTTLANNERQADAKRFLEMLRAALANPTAWRNEALSPHTTTAPTTQPGPAVDRSASAPAAENSLVEDLKLVDRWMALDDDDRAGAIERHVASLNPRQLASLKANLEEAQSNVGQRISEHRENEARIAAGRFVEDQMSYRMGRLAGAPPDADWLAALQNYERIKAFLEALYRYISAVDEERQRPAPPPSSPKPPAAQPAPTVKPAAPASGERTQQQEAGAKGETRTERKGEKNKAQVVQHAKPRHASSLSPQVEALRQMLERELSSGRIAPGRAPAYRRTLEKIESISQAHARGDLKAEAAFAQTQELIADIMRYVADPGTASARATPRGREVLRHAGALKTAIAREFKNSPPAATAVAARALMDDVTKAQDEAARATDEAALAGIEAELLRPAARTWHELMLTRHAVLARPFWECNEVVRSVNTLFYSGARDLHESLQRLAEGKRLSVDDTRPLQTYGQSRWDALNASHVAVFDLRLAPDIEDLATRAPKQARELAGTAYELGLAFALGKPVVLLASPGESLPFDIDLSPVLIDGTEDDRDAIAEALDEAFYVAQRESRRNSIPEALAEMDRLTRDHPRRQSIEGMGWLDPSLKNDAAGFTAAARQLIREIDQAQCQLLRPAWPGAHPDAAQPRCFHVMPFRPPWADEARDTARASCRALGLAYRRGDEAEEGRIVHAVWDDLCRATVVLVELHGGNLNVMIELGIAHALGRPVLAVRRSGGQDVRPRHIEKLRVHAYDTVEQLSGILMTRLKPIISP